MPKVFEIARYFLWLSVPNTEKSITHLKLQKLVYYAQGFYLAIYNQEENPLFGERIEAWVHGPVCPALYNNFRSFGYSVIPKVEEEPQGLTDQEKSILRIVWQVYGSYSGEDLERFTHQEEPWLQARGNLNPWDTSNNQISIPITKEFFRKKLFGDN